MEKKNSEKSLNSLEGMEKVSGGFVTGKKDPKIGKDCFYIYSNDGKKRLLQTIPAGGLPKSRPMDWLAENDKKLNEIISEDDLPGTLGQ